MTTKVEELSISRRAIRRGNSLYFAPDDARSLVKECEKNDLAVIGIDGLTLDETGIQAHLDLIADYTALAIDWSAFSWEAFRKECNASALGFFDVAQAARKPGELVFDLSLMGNDEYAAFTERRARWFASRSGTSTRR